LLLGAGRIAVSRVRELREHNAGSRELAGDALAEHSPAVSKAGVIGAYGLPK